VEPNARDLLTIGEVSHRSGVAPSALRFYESLGLIGSQRSPGGHRLYPRHVLRRVAFIRIAQRMGLSLDRVADALAILPPDRAPTKAQWASLSRSWRRELDERIRLLESLRDDLTSCIGCGCLSLQTCKLSNPDDVAATRGESARYLLGDDPAELVPALGETARTGPGG
jgi:MerR family transcriptional regulator, redox-sensitive transcriptional activator SoxR